MKEIPLVPKGILWSNGLTAKVDDESLPAISVAGQKPALSDLW